MKKKRSAKRTVTATCVEARRERKEEGRLRYKLSRSHAGIPVRPRRNSIQNWKERSSNTWLSLVEYIVRIASNLFLSRVLTAEVNPLGGCLLQLELGMGSYPFTKAKQISLSGRWTDFVDCARSSNRENTPPGIESERIVGERYGKTVGLTVLRPSKNCPTMMAGLRFDPRWILKRSNWLLGNSEAANCRRGGKKSSGKKEWRGEMKIVLFLWFFFWRKNFMRSVIIIRPNRGIYGRPR